MARKPRDTAIFQPNLGLYLSGVDSVIPSRAIRDGNNFRVEFGKLTKADIGYTRFTDRVANGPVIHMATYANRAADSHLLAFTYTDIYRYVVADDDWVFMTPTYTAGTAAASGTAVTGTGTEWDTTPVVKPGDEIAFGAADENDPDATWFVVESVESDTGLTLEATAGTVADGPYTIRRLFTGNAEANTQWDSDMFINGYSGETPLGDVLYATNGLDTVVKWDGITAAFVYTAIDFFPKRLRTYNNMLVFGDITQGGDDLPTDIINSDVNEPETVSGGLSEQFRIHSSISRIVGMRPLGEYLVIYLSANGQTQVVLAQFVGDPFIFVFRNVVGQSSGIGGHGAISGKVVADLGDHHLYMGPDTAYRFDGSTIVPIGNHIWPTVLRNFDPSRSDFAHAITVNEKSEVIWALPFTTDPGAGGEDVINPQSAYVTHYREVTNVPNGEMPVSKRDFPFLSGSSFFPQETLIWDDATMTWDAATFPWTSPESFEGFPIPIVGDAEGRFWRIYTGTTADGESMEMRFRFGRRRLGGEHRRSLVNRVYPYINAPLQESGTVSVYLWLHDHQSDVGTEVGPFNYDLSHPEGGHFVTPYRRARVVAVEFNDNASTDAVWEFEGYDWEVREGGKR